tara:strand:+ start:1724 stop:3370 length:1647 start_codon:yes stop_codon:yes gene_type:complete
VSRVRAAFSLYNNLTAVVTQLEKATVSSSKDDALSLNLSANRIGSTPTALNRLMTTASEAVRLRASFVVDAILAQASTGNFMPYFFLTEETNVSDASILSFFRSVSETAAAAESAAISLSRSLNHAGYVTDAQRLDLSKVFANAASVTDTRVIESAKAFRDSPKAVDLAALAPHKFFNDTINVTDDVDGAASILDDQEMQFVKVRAETAYVADTLFRAVTFRRYFSDVTSFSDATEVGTSKTFAEATGAVDQFSFIAAYARELADSSVVSDAITRRAVDKVLSDTSAAADQFDRVVAFVRSAYENTSAADNFSVLVQRPAGDDLSVSDVVEILLTVNLLFSDTPTVSDDYSNDFAKHVADAINLQEATALAATKTAADATGLSDAASSGVGKSATEAVSSSDSQTSVFTKGVEDTPAFADTRFAVYQKALTDTATASDDVDGEATLLDDQEIQFLKQRTDAATISDVILVLLIFVRNPVDTTAASESASKAFARSRADSALLGDAVVASPGKGVLETTSTSDEGSLRSQGYADFIYFAEDYVGASQTF